MAALSLTTASAVLKTFYLPPLQTLFNKQTILWDRVERNEKWNPEGKNFTLALRYARHANAGVGRAGTSATLPAADTSKYQNAIVPAAYIYTRIQIEGPVIEAARSNAGSFVRAIRSEIEGAAEATRKSLNRQANGDGRDALGYIQANIAGTTAAVLVDASGNQHNVFLQPGVATTVDIYNANDTLNAAGVVATLGADGTNGYAVTFGVNVTANAGSYLVPASTFGFQMSGLRQIVNTGDGFIGAGGLHGLPVGTYPWWVSQVVGTLSTFGATTNQQDLRFTLLQRVISKVAKNSPNGKDDIKFILASYAGQDTYYELASNERIAVNTMVLDGGYEGVEFSGIPIVADPEHWDGYYDFIVPDALRICQLKDVDWMDKDGNVLFRVANADAYEATLFTYMNLGTPARNSLGALQGINMTSV